eukprot:3251460-Prymnesium_polylepis.1
MEIGHSGTAVLPLSSSYGFIRCPRSTCFGFARCCSPAEPPTVEEARSSLTHEEHARHGRARPQAQLTAQCVEVRV